MGKKRKMPGLNTSSTADISFMLLIFFLVTTSMDTDQGLARTLPKPPEDDQLNNEIKVKERNILNIRINKDNYLLIGDDYATLADVKERAKEFIKNEDNAKEEFGYKYEFLTADQQKAIREVYPQKISEAEPKKYGGQQ